jgi:hypothetical protein
MTLLNDPLRSRPPRPSAWMLLAADRGAGKKIDGPPRAPLLNPRPTHPPADPLPPLAFF